MISHKVIIEKLIELTRFARGLLPIALTYSYPFASLSAAAIAPLRAKVLTELIVSTVYILIALMCSLRTLGGKNFMRCLLTALDIATQSTSLALALLCIIGIPVLMLLVGVLVALMGGLASFLKLVQYIFTGMLYVLIIAILVAIVLTIWRVTGRFPMSLAALFTLSIAVGMAQYLYAFISNLVIVGSISASLRSTQAATGLLCGLITISVTILIAFILSPSTLCFEIARGPCASHYYQRR